MNKTEEGIERWMKRLTFVEIDPKDKPKFFFKTAEELFAYLDAKKKK